MDHLTTLLLAAQGGDHDALERFVIETQHDVSALCRYLGDRDNADDLAQETYARAIASLHRFRATGPAKHWLLTIARRTCADAARRRARQRRLHRRVVDQPDQPVVHRTDATDLDELMFALDPDRRAAFVLTQINGLAYDEAAVLLDVPIGTIRSRVARARQQIVDALEQAERDAAASQRPARRPRA